MADDNRSADGGGTVVSFRPRGGASPGLPPLPGAPPPAPPTAPPPPPDDTEPDGDGAAAPPAPRRRRSVADSLTALTPSLPPAPGAAAPAVTLRTEGLDPDDEDGEEEADGPGLGTLGLAAALAVALAALRGTATALQDRRQRRLEKEAETAPLREARLKNQLAGETAAAKHGLAMQGLHDKAAQRRAKALPSSHDYGRKALGGGRGSLTGGGGRSSGSGGGGRGSGGAGRPAKHGSTGAGSGGPKQRTAPGATKAPSGRTTSPSTGGGGRGAASKGSGAAGRTAPKSPGKGIVAPSNGRSQGGKHRPSLERARGRNERRAAAQAARQQRRGARHAAGLEERAQVRGASRQRKQAAQEARRAAKEAKRNGKRNEKKAADAGRVTLGEATVKEMRRRLKKRRKHLDPPVLSKVKRKKKDSKGKDGAKPAVAKVDLTKKPKPGSGPAPKVDLTKKPKAPGPGAGSTAPKVDLTKKKAKKPGPGAGGTAAPKVDLTKKPKTPKTPGAGPGSAPPKVNLKKKPGRPKGPTPGRGKGRGTGGGKPASGGGPFARHKQRRKDRTQRAGQRAKAKAGQTGGTTGATGPGAWTGGARRSAYDSMRATDPFGQTVITVESLHVPGSRARRWEPAAVTTGARALPVGTGNTSTPIAKEASVGTAPAVTTPMQAGMSAEHATEVTLDDVIDFLDTVVSQAFATHDECVVLAGEAKEIRYALDELAAVLAAKHNIIGTVTGRAMHKLAESMELLSRKAEEMQTESLNGAETCEVAKTEMDDAYRPYTQATADAGLRTPSARIHNEH
ncbi:hypothetical protein [Streptomyces sp. NPDC021096]|uniref:hypothetical protein n=1 Tax=Streptomyces sp. NPDC021096 TaxID=3154792 RepID=UPI0033C0B4CE